MPGAQRNDRPEPRQHQRRIAAADQPRDDGDAHNTKQKRPVAGIMQSNGMLKKATEGRLQNFHQGQRQDQGDERHQHRFAQELGDKLGAARTMGLAQRDLMRPQQRARRRQIHEVEAGNEHDQHADNANAIKRGPTAGGLFVPLPAAG